MRLKHLLLALPLSVALTAATPLAYADDEAPAPKKVRVRLKRAPAKDAAATHPHTAGRKTKSPLGAIRTWLMGKMGESMAGGGAKGDRLAAWFDGGADVPLAGLRDALKADGWTAPTLKMWMMGEMARVGPQMMQLFASRGGERGPASRGFTLFGQQDESRRPGMPDGLHLGHLHPGQGMQHGRGMRGHGMQGHGGMGGHGMQAGPGGWHGFHPGHARRGGRGMRRQGMRGQGMRRRGMHGGGMRRHGMRGQGFHGSNRNGQGGMHFGGMGHPRMQTQQRTIILWNDGSGWHQKTIPGGMPGMGHGHGAHPRMHPGMRSMMQGVPGMPGAPGRGWMPGHPGKAGKPGTHGGHGKHGMGGRHGPHGQGKPGAHGPHAPMGHGKQGSPDLGALLKMFGGLQGPEGATIDGATLETLFKALKQHGVDLGIGGGGLTPAAPKKVRIQVQKPKRVKVIEQVEIVK